MTPTWVVQSNLPNSDSQQLITRCCACIGLPVHPVSISPRQLTLPSEMPSGPLIAHGATTLVTLAVGDVRFRHGVFYNALNFCHAAYQREFGEAYLNHAAELVSWDEAIKIIGTYTRMFVKPPDDLKAFTGFATTQPALQLLFRRLSNRPDLLPAKIVIGPSHEVDAEWRLFVVGNEIISGSMYRPSADSFIPADLLDFANEAIRNWQPAPVFVIDVGRVDARWRIIECNCFN